MTNTDIHNRPRILHLVVSHGADQYDVHFHMERPPLVRDLMEDLENKTHVPIMNQQVFYRGERLHETPNRSLEQYGIFNGNHINLVGEKLTGTEEEHFGHLLNLERDVKVIDGLLELICNEFKHFQHRNEPRNQNERYLHDLYVRSERCRSDFQTFQSIAMNINITPSAHDAYRKKNEINALIRDRIDISSNVISAITSYQGGSNDYKLPTNDHYLFHKH
ncbi:unnamed protein product [Adineta steineri]|uniref:Ubiquitin-like domain-containing protein n=1 Tax=Adineta steineri TaxID=433720 RepID=A0A818JNV3_9BILA|nr:unnamed protein product [Adineta steineri]CAF3539026.1 unnamed protein product [Adineta steineri]